MNGRITLPDWSIAQGVKPGHTHVYEEVNCQDASVIAATNNWAWGLVCDGCSGGDDPNSGMHSEVGAKLISNVAIQEIRKMIAMGHNPKQIVETLFTAITRFITLNLFYTCQVGDPQLTAWYIDNYWLTTILGFVMNEDKLIIFRAGDGVICVNDEYENVEQNNRPTYIAYNCLERPDMFNIPTGLVPKEFVVAEYDLTDIQRVMIATDGYDTTNPNKFITAQVAEPDLTDNLKDQQWGKKGQTGLKRWMNTRSDRGFFDDDCAIITIEQRAKP